MIYVTPDKTFGTLAEAIANGEGFVAATDDHEYAAFVDWQELDDDARAILVGFMDLDEDQIQMEMVGELEDLSEEDRAAAMLDDLTTLGRWLEMQGKGLQR